MARPPPKSKHKPAFGLLLLVIALFALLLARAACSQSSSPTPGTSWAAPSGELHDLALRVRTLGKGPPTIVLLHGLAGSNQYFGRDFDRLASEARIVAPDLLGFGSSPRSEDSDYGPDAHVDALIQTLEALHVQGNVYVVAHSAGVLVGLRLAARRPDWVRGILAFGPPIYPNEASARTRIAKLGPMVRFLAMDTVWAQIACKALYPFPGMAGRLASQIRPDLPAPIAEDGVKHSWASYSGTVRNLILSPQPPAELDSLRIPIRWIAGAQDDVIEIEYLRELARTHDTIELDVWSGGHDLPLTDAAAAVAEVRKLAGLSDHPQP